MLKRALRVWLLGIALTLIWPIVVIAAPACQGSPDQRSLAATPGLVREVQFMLLSLGIDPGPIDGNAGEMTNRAAGLFQQRMGIPETGIVNNQPVSSAFVERLRREAAQALLRGTKPEASPSPPPPQPAETAVAPSRPAPPPDRFAVCTFNPDDFRVGGRQYTPQSFLDDGFDGVTARAVANLRQRLDEARQIAEKIGGPALLEVQRQAHVLAYFECRQKIEQASAPAR
jgi:peptidoglycan hydrolase-like protein with peptidoglycan-binding domain